MYHIVHDPMHDYLGKGHELYADRYYASITVIRDSYARQTLAVGTCQTNRRGMAKIFLMQNFPLGLVVSYRQGLSFP